MHKRMAVLMTGASGAALTYRFLQEARKAGVETHLVVTRAGGMVIKQELGLNVNDVERLASFSYPEHNFMAPIASGSFRLDGVLVAPCSMKTLAGIAHGYEDNLVIRSASIALKERWRLVIMPRETPLSTIQIRNMLTVSEAGAIVMPPLPQFYFRPTDVSEVVEMTVGKMLSTFGIENALAREWGFSHSHAGEYEEERT